MVFSFAVAALIEGRVDAAWARWVRPWTLAAWSLLTVGITLGAFWAYYELGWGGWWFWDPVENASFMPWLAGTALLHSAIVTEKRGALAGLDRVPGPDRLHLLHAGRLPGALGRADLGARLRGRPDARHAAAQHPGRRRRRGFALFAWRAPKLNAGGLFAPISREGALVVNNLFLAGGHGDGAARHPLSADPAGPDRRGDLGRRALSSP